ncbi:MAG TPA: DUF1800 domain-containing protein [Allocoleopsis sp.]
MSNNKFIHVINRLTFGVKPGDINQIKSIGIDNYIKGQLNPQSLPEPSFNLPNNRNKNTVQQATELKLFRSVTSPRQLQEVMVEFWFNHFNVFSGKGIIKNLTLDYEQNAIRPNVFGKFRDLLAATSKHPAMLFYLDNWQNTAPNSPGASGRFKGLNENYARELMELHTLGVNGGYSQKDIIELAKILTGWGFPGDKNIKNKQPTFYFNANRHDNTDKIFLKQPIKSAGINEGEKALDILAKHPSTARFISYKLAQYFVVDNPPKTLVQNLAKRFQETDGNIKAVLNTLFQSPEFTDPKFYNAKFKTPLQYLVSAIRTSGIEIKNNQKNWRPIIGLLKQLGMPIYGCITPDGYKNTQEAWLNPDGMLRRISFATALANGRFSRGKSLDEEELNETLGDNFSAKTKEVINTSPQKIKAALILGSPEFMRK